MSKPLWTIAALTLGLAACGNPQEDATAANEAAGPGTAMVNETGGVPAGRQAVATLQTSDGRPAGTATAIETEGAILLSLSVEGLPPGPHGAHVHMTGRCDAPGFESAGGHWNPSEGQHGLENPEGPHAGDMPNLEVSADGRGSLEYRLQAGSFAGLLDGDGSAMMIHETSDDQRTDPSGNSGGRIACGVFAAQE